MTALLEVDGVTKAFGNLVAVDRISFELERGAVLGIAGPNGAGKTTLFNVLSGVPSGPDSGTIRFEGRALESLPPHEICRRGLARTFQKEAVFDALTVAENVRIGAVYGARLGHDAAAIVDRELVAFDLEAVRGERAATLPLFVKKRLMIATAMATGPKALLLDEPVSGLNMVELAEMEAIIRRINAAGVAIILIEHVLPLLMAVSSSVMVMNQGRRLLEGAPDEVVQDPLVIEAYLGERWRETHRGQPSPGR
jgi:branched-chain amino acid transport system ATP-binding protein